MILARAAAAEGLTEVIGPTILTEAVENAEAIEATTTEGTTSKISESNSTGISPRIISMIITERAARPQTRCIRSARATTVATETDSTPTSEISGADREASTAEVVASSEAEAIVMATSTSVVAVVATPHAPKTETGKRPKSKRKITTMATKT